MAAMLWRNMVIKIDNDPGLVALLFFSYDRTVCLLPYTLNWQNAVVWKAYTMNNTTQRFFWKAGKLASILRHHGDNNNKVYQNPLQNLLGNTNTLKINIWQYMEQSSKLVIAVFPEFHPVASFAVYALHSTTFRCTMILWLMIIFLLHSFH